MADSCIISKEQLSQKEQSLKARLYGAQPVTQTAPAMALPAKVASATAV